MPSKLRLDRIGDRIQQELSEMLVMGKVHDPRLSGVYVTGVKVDRELAFADVFLSAVEGAERAKDVLAGMTSAGSFLRHELSQRIELRVFPRLRFHWDPTPERADRIERLLASLREENTSPLDADDTDDNEEVDTDA